MGLKRFRPKWRLWICVSLALFVVPWFVPMLSRKGGPNVPPGVLWVGSFAAPDQLGEDGLMFIGVLTLLFGIPAVALGWVLQGIIVMIGDARRRQ